MCEPHDDAIHIKLNSFYISRFFIFYSTSTCHCDILGTLWPHAWNHRIRGGVHQPFEVLEECVLVLLQETLDAVHDITSIVPKGKGQFGHFLLTHANSNSLLHNFNSSLPQKPPHHFCLCIIKSFSPYHKGLRVLSRDPILLLKNARNRK